MDFLPLFFDLKQRPCLLVGGGVVAQRKASLLTRAGAQVMAVAPQFTPELARLVGAHGGTLLESEYRAELLDGKVLVVAATDDDAINRQVHADAMARQIPVNVVDSPELCSFIFPSIVDRSPILVAVSSGGQSPVLARLLRARLETLIPSSFGRLGQLAGRFRERVKQRFESLRERRQFWERVLQGAVAEKVAAGRDAEAEALMSALLAEDGPSGSGVGEVYLVGAGPGDPELLTFKALRLMQQADVILYDRLVSEQVMALCRVDAERIYVGKERSNHALPQEAINQLLVTLAQQGKRVLRLKGGDPFIFGRGGEELELLAAAGVPFQVVPGITAASACSTAAGIPLTHRGYAQSVKFVTGQLKNRSADLNWAELVHPNQTIVFYMGLHRLANLCEQLVAHGKPATTPVALVQQGGTANQRVLTGTLETIVALNEAAQLQPPSLIIVGEVVELHHKLAWYGARTGGDTGLIKLLGDA